MKNKFKCGMRANCKMIDDACCIDLKKTLEEFYKKQAEITKRLEEREKMNNKFKYVFEDNYNFYYADNIVYKYFEYIADDSEPRMVGTVKVVSVEMTTAMVFNEEEQAVEALYCVCFAVNDSEKKYSIALTKNALTKNDLINKLGFTIVAKKNNPSDTHA